MDINSSKEELEKALEIQMEKAGWTFFDEREFLENLMQTRFNFLITVYAFFFSTFFLCEKEEYRLIIAIIASIIIFLISLTICRIYIKADIVLKILYELDSNYTSGIIKKELGRCSGFLPNVNKFIGYRIPIVLLITSVLGVIYSMIKVL
ncbi:MAG: hypothetical protein FWF55_07050 [Treponema sp.]|nr:hypothetical protein [Treponema sp.]